MPVELSGAQLVMMAFEARGPIPIEVILCCAPLMETLSLYLPGSDADTRPMQVGTILQEFLIDREDEEHVRPQKIRTGNREELSAAEYAIVFGRLLFIGPVGKGEDDYKSKASRQNAAMRFESQKAKADPRRIKRAAGYCWSRYRDELETYLARRYRGTDSNSVRFHTTSALRTKMRGTASSEQLQLGVVGAIVDTPDEQLDSGIRRGGDRIGSEAQERGKGPRSSALRARWQKHTILVSAFVAAFAAALIAVSFLEIVPSLANRVPFPDKNASQSPSTSPRIWTPASLSGMSGCKGAVPNGLGSDIVTVEFAQDGTCWSPSALVNPSLPVYVLLEYKNDGPSVATNVTVRLTSDDQSIRLVDATTYWGNARNPDGVFVGSNNLTSIGVNVGAYAKGGNVWVLAQLDISRATQLACGDTAHKVSVLASRDLQPPVPAEDLQAEALLHIYKACK